MAKKVEGYIKLQIAAGNATPAPPVGPAPVSYTHLHHARTRHRCLHRRTGWRNGSGSNSSGYHFRGFLPGFLLNRNFLRHNGNHDSDRIPSGYGRKRRRSGFLCCSDYRSSNMRRNLRRPLLANLGYNNHVLHGIGGRP